VLPFRHRNGNRKGVAVCEAANPRTICGSAYKTLMRTDSRAHSSGGERLLPPKAAVRAHAPCHGCASYVTV
ncbi:MAG: hypothetical protein RSA78_09845, partial [Oscillospiraceae bacterium]